MNLYDPTVAHFDTSLRHNGRWIGVDLGNVDVIRPLPFCAA